MHTKGFFPGKRLVKNIQIHSQTAEKLKSSWRKACFEVSACSNFHLDVWASEMHTVQSSSTAGEDQNRFHIFVATYGSINSHSNEIGLFYLQCFQNDVY